MKFELLYNTDGGTPTLALQMLIEHKTFLRVMPGVSQRRFHSTIQHPAAEAIDLLAPHSKEILEAWRIELEAFGCTPADFLMGLEFNFSRAADWLRTADYSSFRQNVQSFGEKLAQKGWGLPDAVRGMNRLYESCLPHLARSAPKRASPVLALARLQALLELLLVSGYKGQWGAGKRSLVEASLAETEERRREASAYVTTIYERERSRYAHDLHDGIGHDLILVKLYLEMLAAETKIKTVRQMQKRLQGTIAMVTRAVEAVRRLNLELGPAVFEDLGFLPAVRSYVNHFASHTGIDVNMHAGYVPPEIPVIHQVALYRLLQEALSNVLKHAQAQHVNIDIASKDHQAVAMYVEDDGVGFDTEKALREHAPGLVAMNERAEVLGGECRIISPLPDSSKGTKVDIYLPLPGGIA